MSFSLNERAAGLTQVCLSDCTGLGISTVSVGRALIIDAGVRSRGSIAAGLAMARVCLANLGGVTIVPSEFGPAVQVITDHPIKACLASQYAGWQVSVEKWFGMGSGPMRAAYGKEPLYDNIGHRERPTSVVGVLEASKLPTEAVVEFMANKLQIPADRITLWVAPTSSVAGMTQVVARSVEVALHKLHELKFDLASIRTGYGIAPMPTATADDLVALGRTNDAVLYAGRVHLTVETDDAVIAEVGPRVPASSSPTFGTPFLDLFKAAGHDFYKMDPQLFAPAEIVFHNRKTGQTFAFGKSAPEVVCASFGL